MCSLLLGVPPPALQSTFWEWVGGEWGLLFSLSGLLLFFFIVVFKFFVNFMYFIVVVRFYFSVRFVIVPPHPL